MLFRDFVNTRRPADIATAYKLTTDDSVNDGGYSSALLYDTTEGSVYFIGVEADGTHHLPLENMQYTGDGTEKELARLEYILWDWCNSQMDADPEEPLHELARRFMDIRPDLPAMSLDEWLCEYHEQLTEPERKAGHAILSLFSTHGGRE